MIGGLELQIAMQDLEYFNSELVSLQNMLFEYKEYGFNTDLIYKDINILEEAIIENKQVIENMGGSWE